MRQPDRHALPARSLDLALAHGQVRGGNRQQILGTLDSGGGGGACAYCSGLAGKPIYH